jgi:hypothetical protein
MIENILLEPEQEELLERMVEAQRNLARHEREKFALLVYGQGDVLLHKGLRSDYANVFAGDVEALQRAGLLAVSYSSGGTAHYDITPLGYAYYERLKGSD